jgi:hypothetical protein
MNVQDRVHGDNYRVKAASVQIEIPHIQLNELELDGLPRRNAAAHAATSLEINLSAIPAAWLEPTGWSDDRSTREVENAIIRSHASST